MISFMPESPRYLYEHGRYEECRESLRKVRNTNGDSSRAVYLFKGEPFIDENDYADDESHGLLSSENAED